MWKIIQLDKHLINQISAWEVVERPISVVKELIENALDAGATNIKIEIMEWWKKQIIVSDNGSGIELGDLEICLEKYTTSKIKNIQDLYQVLTFWFRWEALASISSVSEIELLSKIKSFTHGYKLTYSHEKWKNIESASCPDGTTIHVKNLFYNTPARLNYLKQDRTEYSKILSYLENAILSRPDVGFEFISDNKKIFKYSSNETLKTRIYHLYGEELSEQSIEIHWETTGIKVNGYISNPKISFINKNKQHIFVNNRPIYSPIISKAISDAYHRFIPHASYPAYIIFLDIDPTIIDVNVHPRKTEIRFENEQNIFRICYHSVLDKLEKSELIHPINNSSHINSFENISFSPSRETKTPEYFSTNKSNNLKEFSPYKNTITNPNQYSLNTPPAHSSLPPQLRGIEGEFSWDLHYTKLGKIVWQTFDSYIIVENKRKIIILDQHALAERVIYEKLIKLDKKNESQKLLFPENIKLTSVEIEIILDKKDIFENMWFEIEILNSGIISIYTIPDFIKKERLWEIFVWIINDIASGNLLKSNTLEEIKNKIYAYTACRSAIKFGNKLNLFEMNKLLNESVDTYSSTCPHGRPVIFEIDLEELKNKYER